MQRGVIAASLTLMATPLFKVQLVEVDQAPNLKVRVVGLNEAPEWVVKEVSDGGGACDLRVAEGNPAEVTIAFVGLVDEIQTEAGEFLSAEDGEFLTIE